MAACGDEDEEYPAVVELNIGGVAYTTSLETLTRERGSYLSKMFTPGGQGARVIKDSRGKYFIDRDGVLFRYVLDYLRDRKLILPENFHEHYRLKQEAEYFDLPGMVCEVASSCSSSSTAPRPAASSSMVAPRHPLSPTPAAMHHHPVVAGAPTSPPGYISVGYRGTFASGRDALADVKFRKVNRILVCGRVTLCREVFGDTLNDSRDPDRGSDDDRYSARFYLKHNYLEQAFDNLQEAGFRCCTAAGSGTSCGGSGEPLKPGMDSEENRWNHYNEFIFSRP